MPSTSVGGAPGGSVVSDTRDFVIDDVSDWIELWSALALACDSSAAAALGVSPLLLPVADVSPLPGSSCLPNSPAFSVIPIN